MYLAYAARQAGLYDDINLNLKGRLMKLTNKQKHLIKQALFQQVDNILMLHADKYSGINDDLRKISPENIAEYCYKVIGLYPVPNNT